MHTLPWSRAGLGQRDVSDDEALIGKLTTHVLDTAHGCPAAGMVVRLVDPEGVRASATHVLDADGRVGTALAEGAAFVAGRYRLEFAVADYFRARGVALPDPPFLDRVAIDFAVADVEAKWHVPLLVSPWSYSTYRGS